MNKVTFLLFIPLLTGCMIGPNYEPPCLEIPDQFHYELDSATASTATIFWEQFQDPVLNELIDEALQNNYTVKIAAANIENAAGILLQTQAPLYPQIGYNTSDNRTLASKTLAAPIPSGVANPQTYVPIFSTLSWQVDIWGRISRQVESARASYFATIEARRQVILALVASVASSYLELRGLDEQLNSAKNSLESYKEMVDYFTLQYQHGQVSLMNVVQAETQYELAATVIPQIELQIVGVENILCVLLGSNPKQIPRGKSVYELIPPEVPAGIPSEVLLQRPDISEAEDQLIAANAEIGAAEALYFPSISLTGDLGSASSQLHNLFKGPSRAWDFTGSVIGPIFTWGAIEGQVEQAVAQTEAALFNYQQSIQQAFAEVETALASYTYLKEQLAAQERLVKASKEYEHLARLQYDGGYTPYFTVLQAQQQLFPAELQLAALEATFLNSLVNIYQTMGGGWVNDAVSKSSSLR